MPAALLPGLGLTTPEPNKSLRIFSLAATLAFSISFGAIAQSNLADRTATPSVAASAVGHWLHSPQGDTIGSVRGLADGGSTAVIMIGSYFRPGSHEARVPARMLSIVDGKVMLQAETVEALNATSSR